MVVLEMIARHWNSPLSHIVIHLARITRQGFAGLWKHIVVSDPTLTYVIH